jgi:hypothetical protein
VPFNLHPRAGKGLDEDAQRGARIAAEIPDFVGGFSTGDDGPPGGIQAYGHGRQLQASIPPPGREHGIFILS